MNDTNSDGFRMNKSHKPSLESRPTYLLHGPDVNRSHQADWLEVESCDPIMIERQPRLFGVGEALEQSHPGRPRLAAGYGLARANNLQGASELCNQAPGAVLLMR